MAAIGEHLTQPTITAIYQWWERNRAPVHRPHLGGSQIGHSCSRFLWYQFHWCELPQFDGRMLRLFDHGDTEEQRLIRDLQNIGITVLPLDPDTGKQWHFTAHGGHFALSLDGVGQGFAESKEWHLLEFKTHNEKSFKALVQGVETAKPQHAAQMQIGMELADMKRAYYFATNKNNEAIYGERLHRDRKQGKALLARAERVIFSEEPLERISDKPDWYECKNCDFHAICHDRKAPLVNCRTCLHSTAERNGTWSCAWHEKTLDDQSGCPDHLYRPALVGYPQADAGPDWVSYESKGGIFRNGPRGKGSYTSEEIRAADPNQLPLPAEIEAVRLEMGGVVSAS